MEKKDFKDKLGKKFTLKLSEQQSVELELSSVESLEKPKGTPDQLPGENVPQPRTEPFSLVFIGPNDHHLPDNTYTMGVEGGEEQQIFISAFKEDDKGIHYDSVFN